MGGRWVLDSVGCTGVASAGWWCSAGGHGGLECARLGGRHGTAEGACFWTIRPGLRNSGVEIGVGRMIGLVRQAYLDSSGWCNGRSS